MSAETPASVDGGPDDVRVTLLRPCPFCENPKPELYTTDALGTSWRAACIECGASSATGSTRLVALALWNRRPSTRDAALREEGRVQGLEEGFELAQEYAEISEHDGWVRTAPFIEWGHARKKLAARLAPQPDASQGSAPTSHAARLADELRKAHPPCGHLTSECAPCDALHDYDSGAPPAAPQGADIVAALTRERDAALEVERLAIKTMRENGDKLRAAVDEALSARDEANARLAALRTSAGPAPAAPQGSPLPGGAVPRGHCNRCERCGWEVSDERGRCRPKDCSMRPMPPPRTHCAGCGAVYDDVVTPGAPATGQLVGTKDKPRAFVVTCSTCDAKYAWEHSCEGFDDPAPRNPPEGGALEGEMAEGQSTLVREVADLCQKHGLIAGPGVLIEAGRQQERADGIKWLYDRASVLESEEVPTGISREAVGQAVNELRLAAADIANGEHVQPPLPAIPQSGAAAKERP